MASRILLADDSITIQKVVNLTFADEGIEVVAVSNGELAERRLGEVNPDLVLADIFMPGKNGYELCESIKQNPQFRNIPVVLLVGAFEPFDQNEAKRVRADAHLTKPFESRMLVETVRNLISKNVKPPTGPIPAMPEEHKVQPTAILGGLPAGSVGFVSEASEHPHFDLTAGSNGLVTPADSDPSPLEIDYSMAPATISTAQLDSPFDPQLLADAAQVQPRIKTTADLINEAHASPDPSFHEKASAAAILPELDAMPEAPLLSDVAGDHSSGTEGVMVDFDRSEPTEAPVPDSVVSFDVEAEKQAPEALETQVVAEATLETQALKPPENIGVEHAPADSGFEFAESEPSVVVAEFSEEPLGDVLSGDQRQAETGFAVEATPESAPLDVDSEPVVTAAEPAAETSGEQPVSEHAIPVMEQSPVSSPEPEPQDFSGVRETFDAVQTNPQTPIETHPSPARSEFTASELWSDTVSKFAPIDVEANPVEEAAAAVNDDSETGFDFTPVVTEQVEYEPRKVSAESAQASNPALLPPEVIESIVRQVVAQMSDSVIRDIAWEIVPDCVERVIERLTRESLANRS